VRDVIDETPRCRSIVLDPPAWPGHRAGQHLDVRLTAEDGYQAQRSYSIASAPEDDGLVLTVERLDDGEVSPYLADELRPGDELEMRGPIGGYFVWEDSDGGPVMLVAGGSGIVPFRAMLRHWAAGDRAVAPRLLYSSRTAVDLIYREELMHLADSDGVDVRFTLTREPPGAWTGHRGRVDRHLLADVSWPPEDRPLVFVCGPSAFVETVAQGLVDTGHQPSRIRTERFGPTGT
jgi:ferredoxin-NADP reductase